MGTAAGLAGAGGAACCTGSGASSNAGGSAAASTGHLGLGRNRLNLERRRFGDRFWTPPWARRTRERKPTIALRQRVEQPEQEQAELAGDLPRKFRRLSNTGGSVRQNGRRWRCLRVRDESDRAAKQVPPCGGRCRRQDRGPASARESGVCRGAFCSTFSSKCVAFWVKP